MLGSSLTAHARWRTGVLKVFVIVCCRVKPGPPPQKDRMLGKRVAVKLPAYMSLNDPVGYQNEIYSPAAAGMRWHTGVVASFMKQL